MHLVARRRHTGWEGATEFSITSCTYRAGHGNSVVKNVYTLEQYVCVLDD